MNSEHPLIIQSLEMIGVISCSVYIKRNVMDVAGLYLPYGEWMFCIQEPEKEIWWWVEKSEINVLSGRELDFRHPLSLACSVLLLNQIWHEPRKWKWAETCPKAHDFSLFLNAFKNENSHFSYDHSEPDIFKARCHQNDLCMIILDNVLWLALQSRVAWFQKNVQPKINSKPSQKELKLVHFSPHTITVGFS